MDTDLRQKCVMAFYDIYPITRKLVFDTFDKREYNITRTQQIILLTLSVSGIMNMSALAERINTSNEQATRAVAQLVDRGFIIREHSEDNRRMVNIRLTKEAEVFLEKMKADIMDDLINKFSEATDEEIEEIYNSLVAVTRILKRVIIK